MSRVPLTLACWDYDRTRPLRDGTVRVDGVDLKGWVWGWLERLFSASRWLCSLAGCPSGFASRSIRPICQFLAIVCKAH